MLGTYFYHQITRKTIIAFGALFNDIYIRHESKDGSTVDETKVSLAYGPMQKFLAKIQQQAALDRSIAITLPRMSFEMNNYAYDASRKTSVTKSFKAVDNNDRLNKVYLPVPYNIGFTLSIFSKLNDDALQIIEQILPFFQPSYNLTVDLLDVIGEKRDIPIVLDSINFQDDYEGDFSTRRALIYTLNFTAKTYLFGPLADSPEGLIRKAQVDLYTHTDIETAKREVRYTVVPDPIDAQPGDDFGFTEEWLDFTDSKTYSPTQDEDV